MKKFYMVMMVLLMLPAYYVNAACRFRVNTFSGGVYDIDHDMYDVLFVVNNASDRWMYLWMGHPNHGEDNGNLNLKPHSSARAIGCSNGAGYAVTGIIVTQGKDVLYTFDVNRRWGSEGWVKLHTWKGGCYVAWGKKGDLKIDGVVHWHMSKMASKEWWDNVSSVRVRIDCV